eukprot:m.252143 g.252143  ORF g.252143 m.252143 type:complete len:322 (-) comp19556_c1_seq1:135-1100(-)
MAASSSAKRRRLDAGDRKQPVCVFPTSVTDALSPGSNNSVTVVSLPHPNTGDPARYVLLRGKDDKGCSVFELNCFEDKIDRSWFVGNTVQQTGELYLCTPIDPMLLVLPLLEKHMHKPNFLTLDQILDDGTYTAFSFLEACLAMVEELEHVCDVRGEGKYKGYKLNHERLILWLKEKVSRTAETLLDTDIPLSGTAQSANFSRSTTSKAKPTQAQRTLYAYGVVSEYLQASHAESLRKEIGVAAASVQDNAAAASNSEKSTKETVASAAPANSSRGPCEDYSVGFQPAAKPADKPTSAAAKKLAKIDKKGMKSMMSFFKKK